MRIKIDGCEVLFPNPSDYDALEPENTAGIARYERARATAEQVTNSLVELRRAALAAVRSPAPEPPTSVKRLAAFGAWCLALSEREKNYTDAGRRLLGAADEFKAGNEVGPT